MTNFEKIVQLGRQLFPTGRVWKQAFDSIFFGLEKGLAASEARFIDDSNSILDSLLPDNDNFSADDATAWEGRLGLIVNTSASLDDRKLAIARKLAFPGEATGRLSQSWFEGQLQAAGFNVFVFENLDNASPFSVSGDSSILSLIEYGDGEYGDNQYGGYYNNQIVNRLPEGVDNNFNSGGTFRTSLIIGGNPRGTYANVPLVRKEEFRQLILKLKPASYIIYLFIHYT